MLTLPAAFRPMTDSEAQGLNGCETSPLIPVVQVAEVGDAMVVLSAGVVGIHDAGGMAWQLTTEDDEAAIRAAISLVACRILELPPAILTATLRDCGYESFDV